jgi:tetratricopeptide (TPR) repeat protein
MRWIADHYEITEMYRQGESERALELLAGRSIDEQRQIVERILGVLEVLLKSVEQVPGQPGPGQIDASQRRPGVPFMQPNQNQAADTTRRVPLDYPAKPASKGGDDPEFRWKFPATNVAGALHMEAALRAYRRDDASSAREIGEQIKIAEGFFGFYERHTGRPTESRRWQLAIGLTAMADGRFGRAATVLNDACARFPDDDALQLACGSIHETIAMMPANVASEIRRLHIIRQLQDNPLTEEDESKPGRFRGSINALGAAKSARDDRLKGAARAFERVLASDPTDTEARLRVAHVRMLQKNEKAAAALLEPIVAATPAPPLRTAYLARLFLGEIHARQRQTARAAPLFEEAVTLVPSGQSAYMALLKLARTTGNQEQATAVLHRMLRAPAQPDDPWIGS